MEKGFHYTLDGGIAADGRRRQTHCEHQYIQDNLILRECTFEDILKTVRLRV